VSPGAALVRGRRGGAARRRHAVLKGCAPQVALALDEVENPKLALLLVDNKHEVKRSVVPVDHGGVLPPHGDAVALQKVAQRVRALGQEREDFTQDLLLLFLGLQAVRGRGVSRRWRSAAARQAGSGSAPANARNAGGGAAGKLTYFS
jgi:hypothetical protein